MSKYMDMEAVTLDGDAVVYVDYDGSGVFWMGKAGGLFYEDQNAVLDIPPTGCWAEVFELAPSGRAS